MPSARLYGPPLSFTSEQSCRVSRSRVCAHYERERFVKELLKTAAELEKRFLQELEEGDSKQALINLAQLYSQNGCPEAATHCVDRLLEACDEPEERAAQLLALGCLSEQIRDYRGAVRRYRQALSLEPSRPQTWYFILNNLGFSLNQLGDYEAAMPYFRRAIDLDPCRSNAFKNLGIAYQAKSAFAEAAQCFVAATRANATDPRSLAHLEHLLSLHPQLQTEIPDLPRRLEACRNAVEAAQDQ